MSGPASAANARRARIGTKSGSHFSDRQIASAVKDGHALRVVLPNGDAIEGWVFGVDNYHWGIVDAGGSTHLVHKSAPCVSVLDWLTMPPTLEEIVGPFRDYVMREHFGQTVAAS